MKYFFVCISLILFWNKIFSQEQFARKIQWSKLQITLNYPAHANFDKKESLNKIYYLHFKNANYPDPLTLLPHYFELLRVENEYSEYKIQMTNQEFEPINQDDIKKLHSLKTINSKIAINSSVEIKRGVPYISISFVPLIKNSTSGRIEKLTNFSLSITPVTRKKSSKQLKSFKSQSVLSSGDWVKIKTEESGIYKITYSELITLGFSNPSNIRIYGNGGEQLPYENNQPFPDDLENNAIYFEKGPDGIFNNEDYILFYGENALSWEYDSTDLVFNHVLHNYSNSGYYFITSGIGPEKVIPMENQASGITTNNVNIFNDFAYQEIEDTNLIKSGRLWFGEHFDIITSRDYEFSFPDIDLTSNIFIKSQFVARSSSSSNFIVSTNNNSENISIESVNTSSYTSDYAKIKSNFSSFSTPSSSAITVNIIYNKPMPSSEGWLDYITINVRRKLIMSGSQLHFRDTESAATGNISDFSLSNSDNNVKVWDITNTQNIKQINTSYSGGVTSFKTNTDSLREFIAFDNTSFLTPEIIGEVQNQNLHSLSHNDLIIISAPEFISQASQLSDFHKNNDGLKVSIVTPEQIYNEFSSGMPDISAIRNFVKMIYNRPSGTDTLKYLLLIGDGSYNNRNHSLILTYQTENSLNPISSIVSDDFFGLLDDTDDIMSGILDLGIGRLPVKSVEEAQSVVNKIINYNTTISLGDWKNNITFVGDDEDNNIHMQHADSLARYISSNYSTYNLTKIFLDAYTQESTAGGEKYPEVKEAIHKSIEKGAFIFNYSGHGNEDKLAHENILGISDILSLENEDRLPLFVTATCEFSRFDNHNFTSAGEHIILNPSGGGVSLLSTTRVVFASQNLVLSSNFYQTVFNTDINGDYYRLGDIIRLTKNASGSGINKRNFTLLGDPALKLAYPKNNTITTQINGISISLDTDTLKALSKITISGYVENSIGTKLTNYNGIIYPVVYDKIQTISTLSNDGDAKFNFDVQSNVLYKGKASIRNGDFDFSFIVPKDIAYSYGPGKISYYFSNSTINKDGAGYNKDIIIGGINENPDIDDFGPTINLYLNDESFINGGATDQNPQILAIMADSSGINTSGSGIGHDITAVLDNTPGSSIVLNDYYESDIDSYQNGQVLYPLKDLKIGNHSLKLKAWDVYNNSSEESIDFTVVESDGLILSHVLNYPNPFTQQTAFYFEHNQPNTDIYVIIQIFTVSGKLIKTIERQINTLGFRAEPIAWNGLDNFSEKIGRGIYIYRIKLRSSNGDITEKFEKLVILK